MTDPDPQPRRWPRVAGSLVGLAVGLLLAFVAWWLWREYNPIINQIPAVREANALRDAARAGPLTDEEFERVVNVAGSGEPVAVLSTVAVLELEASRRPDRREKVTAVLTDLQQSRDASVRQSVAAALARITSEK